MILKGDTPLFYTQQILLVLKNVKARESGKVNCAVHVAHQVEMEQQIVVQQVWLVDRVGQLAQTRKLCQKEFEIEGIRSSVELLKTVCRVPLKR